MRAIAVRGTAFRCYQRLSLELPGGLVAAVGPNGAGKTALVELIHFGLLGYSPRTSDESQLVRFGSDVTRVEVDAALRTGAASVAIGYKPGEPKRVQVDGVTERSVERLLPRFPVLVFTPDRHAARAGPAGASPPLLRPRPGAAVAGTGAGIGRVQPPPGAAKPPAAPGAGRQAGVDALEPWDAMLAEAGAELIAARARLCTRLSAAVAPRLAELGGVDTPDPVRYQPSVQGDAQALQEALLARRSRDIERAVTGAGPHLDDVLLVEADHDLRRFGSQGEQRRALLALILGESDLLGEERDEQPLLLLDDVTSELDPARRARLLEAVSAVRPVDRDHRRPGRPCGSAAVSLLRVEAGRGARSVSELRRVSSVHALRLRGCRRSTRCWSRREPPGRTPWAPAIAAASQPARMTRDAIWVHCTSSAWVSELTMLAADLRARLAERVSGLPGGPPVRARRRRPVAARRQRGAPLLARRPGAVRARGRAGLRGLRPGAAGAHPRGDRAQPAARFVTVSAPV